MLLEISGLGYTATAGVNRIGQLSVHNYLNECKSISAMGDVDDEIAELGRRVLRSSLVDPLRRRMRAFVEEHDRDIDLHRLRRATSDGTPVSDIVHEGRDERL
jgi:hypothetical protein